MARIRVLLLIIFVITFKITGAQTELTFDRPGITDLYAIVPNNAFQAEIGYDYFNLHNEQDELPSLTLRKSFGKRFELRYVYDYALYSPSLIRNYERNNILVHGLGAKVNLLQEGKQIPGISIIATAKGAAKKVLFNERYYGTDIFLVVQKAFGRFEYTNNTGVLIENFGTPTRYMFGNCISYDITERKAVFAEQYSFFTPEKDDKDEFGLIGGFTYQLGSRYQLDASGGIMDFDDSYWFAGVGLSVYLGELN